MGTCRFPPAAGKSRRGCRRRRPDRQTHRQSPTALCDAAQGHPPCRRHRGHRTHSGRPTGGRRTPGPGNHQRHAAHEVRWQRPCPRSAGGTHRGRAHRGVGAGSDRGGLAVAVGQEQTPQHHRRTGPQLQRHPGPRSPERRRELSDHRGGQPDWRQWRDGRRRHRGRPGRPIGHDHAGQHPGQPQTRCGGVVSARPRDHADQVSGMERRNRQVRPRLRQGHRRVERQRTAHRHEAQLRLRTRRPEMPREGHPEDLRTGHQPIHGG